MLVLIDNYDSFTYNLVHYLGELGAACRVFRNDAISVAEVMKLKPKGIVLSPGPCTPAAMRASRTPSPLPSASSSRSRCARRATRPPR